MGLVVGPRERGRRGGSAMCSVCLRSRRSAAMQALTSNHGCVAAPDGLKSEINCTDFKVPINHATKRPPATVSTTVHALSVSDAVGPPTVSHEAPDRHKHSLSRHVRHYTTHHSWSHGACLMRCTATEAARREPSHTDRKLFRISN